ncbi:hypothetical protein ACFL5O_04485 [Myxococcota bacterium]
MFDTCTVRLGRPQEAEDRLPWMMVHPPDETDSLGLGGFEKHRSAMLPTALAALAERGLSPRIQRRRRMRSRFSETRPASRFEPPQAAASEARREPERSVLQYLSTGWAGATQLAKRIAGRPHSAG